jgi:antitoxin ParD1/3/4
MNVSLPPDLESFVQNLVLSGSYSGPDEVVGEALLRFKRQEELRREIQKGIGQLDRGERIAGEDVFASLAAKAQKLSNSGSTT